MQKKLRDPTVLMNYGLTPIRTKGMDSGHSIKIPD